MSAKSGEVRPQSGNHSSRAPRYTTSTAPRANPGTEYPRKIRTEEMLSTRLLCRMAFTTPRGMQTEYVMIALRMPKYRETGMRSLIMSHTGSLYLKELPMVP